MLCHFLGALLVTMVLGRNYNNVTSNYVIYAFEGGATYFPYALNLCQVGGLSTGNSYKFVCASDKKSVTVYTYGNSMVCSGAVTTKVLNTTLTTHSAGQFNCDGSDDYVEIEFGICSCASVPTKIYAALSTCVFLSTKYLNVYCSGDMAEMQYYVGNVCTGTPVSTATANETCGYIFTFPPSTKIYGDVLGCTQGNSETYTSTMMPGSSGNLIGASIISFIGLVMALLH